jgi:hypothetical protein
VCVLASFIISGGPAFSQYWKYYDLSQKQDSTLASALQITAYSLVPPLPLLPSPFITDPTPFQLIVY